MTAPLDRPPFGTTMPQLTHHAAERMQERKVTRSAYDIVLRHGDMRTPSRGCERRRLSRKVAKRLDRTALYARRDIEDARETELVLGDTGRTVTVIRHQADVRFRRSGARATRLRHWKGQEDSQ